MAYRWLYLHNKGQYEELKGGDDIAEFIKEVKDRYSSSSDNATNLDRYKEYDTTYGEMRFEAADPLLGFLRTNNININCFIDMGSGKGKMCVYMCAYPNIRKSIGIEVVKERHDKAIEQRDYLSNRYNRLIKKVILLNDDITNVDFKKIIDINDNILVWISNLCFRSEVNAKICKKIILDMPKTVTICCSAKLDNNSFKQIGTITLPMSWDISHKVFVYRCHDNKNT